MNQVDSFLRPMLLLFRDKGKVQLVNNSHFYLV